MIKKGEDLKIMSIEEIYKIYKDGNFKDKDMQRAFNRSITPEAVQELLSKLEKLA